MGSSVKMLWKTLFVTAAFILLYGFRLNYPQSLYWDEHHYVNAAISMSQLSSYSNSEHPPLSKILIALSIKLFGNVPWAWRLPSLILGAAATALSGYFGFILTGNLRIFWLVSFLLFCDGLWITQARIAILAAPMMFFILAALVLCWHAAVNPKHRVFLIASSACAGLAAACKWQGALVILLMPVLYWSVSRQQHPSATVKKRWWAYGLCITIITYFSTFLIVPFIQGMHWQDIFTLQIKMVQYHKAIESVSFPGASAWYTWPFLIKSLWFYFQHYNEDLALPDQTLEGIFCIGNPFIFILIVPAVAWLLLRQQKQPWAMVALSGFLIFWLSCAPIKRFLAFYCFYPVMPFIAIMIAVMLDTMWQSQQNILRALSACLLFFIILAYIFFFPLWTGLRISYQYYSEHLWLPSWEHKIHRMKPSPVTIRNLMNMRYFTPLDEDAS